MRAIVHSVFSPDVEIGEDTCLEKNLDSLLLQFYVGPRGEMGEESFDVLAVTIRWLEDAVNKQHGLIGKGLFIVDIIDTSKIIPYLTSRFESEEAENWDELARKLSYIGNWEFENYRSK